jgi:16S rRNA G966 N2-methylase RsmD
VAIVINPFAAKLIFENAEKLRAGETIEIINADFLHAISVLDKRIDSFDIIIVAPPYDIGLQQKAMDALVNSNIIKATTLIIVQRDSREPAVELSGRLCFMRTHSYGRTVFDFYKPVDSSIDTNIV